MPLMISSMKVAAAIRSKPVTILLFRVTPRGCRRRSNLEDRIHPTLSARVPSTFQGVCHLRAGTRTSGSVSVAKGDGSRLRTGLATGGRWIRTFGSPTDPLPLGDWFDEAIIGMRYCVQIRNQYAHRNFYENSLGKLAFVNLEELAKRNEIVNDYLSLAIRYVTPTLLEEQEQYFVYVRGTIGFLNYEGRFRSGKIKANPLSPPEKLIQPPHALEISH